MTAGESSKSAKQRTINEREKENLQEHADHDDFCYNCKSSLANSQHVINIAGQSRRWHPHCFKCDICREPMDRKQSCHVYRDQIVCRSDFARLKRDHAIRCARCSWPIAASDWVRRASSHVYHIACFNCDICMRQLNTGEQFVIRNVSGDSADGNAVRLLCRLHFSVEQSLAHQRPESKGAGADSKRSRRSTPPGLSAKKFRDTLSECPMDRLSPDFSQFLPGPATGEPMQQQQQTAAASSSGEPATPEQRQRADNPLSLASASSSSASSTPSSSTMHAHYGAHGPLTPTGSSQGHGSGGSAAGAPCKSKRVRTTFTEDQLSILQTHFQRDSNPDGQDLERIATITGLSKRVTQVWFQNSRARQKKYLIKRKPGVNPATLSPDFNLGLQHENPLTEGNPSAAVATTSSGRQSFCALPYSSSPAACALAFEPAGPPINRLSCAGSDNDEREDYDGNEDIENSGSCSSGARNGRRFQQSCQSEDEDGGEQSPSLAESQIA